MVTYTVSQLAKIAGISVRALHYYDKIGLLRPAKRAKSGYRYYGKKELYRLQQILFFKELEFPLEKIKRILDDPDFDPVKALSYQKKELQKNKDRLDVLLETIDKTIAQIKEENEMVTEKEIYEGFSKAQTKEYEKEVRAKYDPEIVEESKRNLKSMTKKEFRELKEEGVKIAKELAVLTGRKISDSDVQALVKRHFTMNNKFYKTTAEMYKGLADMYVSDHRFTEYYDQHKPGLAAFLKEAMYYFADHNL